MVDPPPEPYEAVIVFEAPTHFPPLEYDLSQNPVTPEGFRLGKKLFMDGRLSRDGSISCAHCHLSNAAFTQHGHALAHGIDNRPSMRNVQPIMNLAWNQSFLWDGGIFHLDLFAIAPIETPVEMDESLGNVLVKLRADAQYRDMFRSAFGKDTIETADFFKALSQFQLMCVSAGSPYDRHVLGTQPLTGDALTGLSLFETKCGSCHGGVLQTDHTFRNNGLPVGNPIDTGRERITGLGEDQYKFRVPSLRNLRYTFPYMHDGRFETLEEVLEHYNGGVIDSPTLDDELRSGSQLGIALSETEKRQLIAFLDALNDPDFVSNPLTRVF